MACCSPWGELNMTERTNNSKKIADVLMDALQIPVPFHWSWSERVPQRSKGKRWLIDTWAPVYLVIGGRVWGGETLPGYLIASWERWNPGERGPSSLPQGSWLGWGSKPSETRVFPEWRATGNSWLRWWKKKIIGLLAFLVKPWRCTGLYACILLCSTVSFLNFGSLLTLCCLFSRMICLCTALFKPANVNKVMERMRKHWQG